MSNFKDYLGDSVYAEFDGWSIVLTTENGYGPSNTISLEPEVLQALFRFNQAITNWVKEQKENNEHIQV